MTNKQSSNYDYKRNRLIINKIKGTVLIEFSVVASLFFFLLFTIIDLGVYGYAKLTMQHAVSEGARYAITGLADLDPDLTDGADRKQAVIEKISQSSEGLFNKVMKVEDIRVLDLNGNPLAGFGQPGELIAIYLDCTWPVSSPFLYPFTDHGRYHFTVSATMKNENF
ncbi:TadE/TadG family type IV pilus assembly protein [Vibrio sp. SCSIO 43137]|uniref:TadE/TadG family type IV pilus assembly protein n=1 Tax=Vibrio sp. SCSIO 43137 TaxID=3021011 RepID=UPI0023070706|nr:TadE family protein [Vibrio sp. SCSIO 43137]WCE28880.1 pilus assembly protein [Vibrio sp. SCSIO 43137]